MNDLVIGNVYNMCHETIQLSHNEIGYTTHNSNGSYSPSDEFSPMIKLM